MSSRYLEEMILYACETCMTFSPNEPHEKHTGHNVIGISGDDYEELSRNAAAHLVLTTHVRRGWEPDGMVAQQMAEARLHADWFSEEDSVYDQ